MRPIGSPNPSLLPMDRHLQADWDAVVIGGGLVGLSTAYALRLLNPRARIVVIEKENGVALHQSGRNSGVVHSGLIYPEDSLKARLCLQGKKKLINFCQNQGIQTRQFGKVFVAVTRQEIQQLRLLEERAKKHQIYSKWLTGRGLRDVEPHVSGMAGLHIPSVCAVDFVQVAKRIFERLIANHVHIYLGESVVSLRHEGPMAVVKTNKRTFTAKRVINCAGVFADNIAKKSGLKMKGQIVPFRGAYYYLKKEKRHMINGLIYPTPNPKLPFLGIHLTRTVDDEVHCGPNAALAFGKTAYRKGEVIIEDVARMAFFPGLYRMISQHKKMVKKELKRARSKKAFLHAVQNLVPDISPGDVVPGVTGIRAQAMRPDGTLVDDFWFEENGPYLHVLNAPSPAATACFAIGEVIAKKVGKLLEPT